MASNKEGVSVMPTEHEPEGWNIVNVSTNCSGSNTPMTNSSCEFVNVGQDGMEYHRRASEENDLHTQNAGLGAEGLQAEGEGGLQAEGEGGLQAEGKGGLQAEGEEPAAVGGAELPATPADQKPTPSPTCQQLSQTDKDDELRHLMEILQQRVRSGSPCHSVSAESDFIQLPCAEKEAEELLDLSAHSSVSSRFNIITHRNVNPYEHSDMEDEEPVGLGESEDEATPDADDRVESDIVVPRPIIAVDEEREFEEERRMRPVRHYIHSPNSHLNTLLTGIALTALGFAVGIATGHWFGSAREAYLQQEIQEGQKLRLRSVQDDLLMCLRKQEDIDQTINKLNEIENILVDAEHWRNEYEELLNIKLANEEKWRQERGELKTALTDVEKSHDRLVQSRSCAHDNEFLSRQESTLKSVHEKLEAGLTDKDQLIEKLQTEMAALKVHLMTAQQMAKAYKKSNEDKSLLILGLKEQILGMEREAFDLKINSEVDAELQNNAQHKQQQTQQQQEVQQQQQQQQPLSADEVRTETTPPDEGERKIIKSEQLIIGPEGTSSSESEPSATEKHTAKIEQLQREITTLQHQIRYYETHLAEEGIDLSHNETNSTSWQLPCIVFNFCDHLKINVSSGEVLRLYEATKGQYENLQSFLFSEWTSLLSGYRQGTSQGSRSASGKPKWTGYLNHTKSKVSEILNTMNSTWQEVKQLSRDAVNPDDQSDKSSIHKKINTKLKNVANVIGKGMEVVKSKLFKVFDRKQESEPSGWMDPNSRADSSQEGNSFRKKSGGNPKFERRLSKLRRVLDNLNAWRVAKMSRSERKKLYERLDDFAEDYSHPQASAELAGVIQWAECQALWWEQNIKGFTSDVQTFNTQCADQLTSWQHSLRSEEISESVSQDKQADASWLFERAEMREFYRDEPDDWYWRRAHDHETLPNNADDTAAFNRDEL